MRTATSLLLSFLLAGAVAAQEVDLEDRYHEAYALEVVDNKPADAARRYLALLREKELPDRLKAQCEFRFAVTCVVLGRPDEARARLSAIAADPKTPRALKPQIEEYRRSLRGAAPGRELDKRLEQIKFQIGKIAAQFTPSHPTFAGLVRELQIIGRPALPFLFGLLDHTDRLLRDQAFLILCTMDAPGLAERWQPAFRVSMNEYRKYLGREPERLAAFAKRLLAMEDDAFVGHAPGFALASSMPEQYFQRLAKLAPKAAATTQTKFPPDHTVRDRLAAWMRTDRPIAPLAAALYRKFAARDKSWVTPESFRLATGRLPATPVGRTGYAVRMMARHLPTSEVLRILEAATPEQMRGTWAYEVAAGLDRRKFDAERYERVVRRWWDLAKTEPELRGYFTMRLRTLLRTGRGGAWVAELLRTAEARHIPALANLLDYEDVQNAELLRAAWSRKEARPTIVELLAEADEELDIPAVAREAARFLPDLAAQPNRETALRAASRFPRLARHLEASEALTIAKRIVDADPRVLAALFPVEDAPAANASLYYGEVLPTLADRVALRSLAERPGFSRAALAVLAAYPRLPREALDAYRLIALRGLADVDGCDQYLVRLQNVLPPHRWVPEIPEARWATRAFASWLDGDAAQPTVEALLAAPERINRNAVSFLTRRSRESSKVLARLLAKADRRMLPLIVGPLDSKGIPGQALLAAVVRLTPDRTVPDAALAALAKLAPPSRKLLPACRRLLAADDPLVVYDAVELAAKLGTKELLPELGKTLDSLDAEVRSAGESAIEAILALHERRVNLRDRLKEEIEDLNAPKAGTSGGSGG